MNGTVIAAAGREIAMPVRLTKLLLNIAIVVLLLAGSVGAISVLLAGSGNGIGQTTVNLRSDKAQVVALVARPAGSKIGEISYDRATMNVSVASSGYRAFQLLDIAVT